MNKRTGTGSGKKDVDEQSKITHRNTKHTGKTLADETWGIRQPGKEHREVGQYTVHTCKEDN